MTATATTVDIRITITGLGEIEVSPPVVVSAQSKSLVERQADDLLPRLGAKNLKMLRAMVGRTGPFTFDDIAADAGETYHAIKMRYFNLGRTIKAVGRDTGSKFELLETGPYISTPQGDRTRYEMPTDLRDELRSRKF